MKKVHCKNSEHAAGLSGLFRDLSKWTYTVHVMGEIVKKDGSEAVKFTQPN